MQIEGWSIDGYGIFSEHEVRDLKSGITIFLGPNEAGKSTLLNFIRGVLFSFPDGRSRRPQYLPLNGGTHGGRLFLANGQARVTVERRAGGRNPAVITASDGAELTEEILLGMLGGADETLFNAVFSFGLDELRDFGKLTQEGIRERIFSAGIVGAGRSAREVIDRLSSRADELYKPRGSKQRLAELRRERDQVLGRLRDARSRIGEYEKLQAAEEEASREEQELQDSLQGVTRRVKEIETVQDLWPVWRDLERQKSELEATDPIDSLPAEASRRLVDLQGEIRSSVKRVNELTSERDTVDGDIRQLTSSLDDKIHQVTREIVDAHAQRPLQLKRLEELQAVETELTAKERDFKEKLSDLGSDWDENRLLAFDTSLPKRDEVREWQLAIRESANTVNEASRIKRSAEEESVRLDEELRRRNSNFERMERPDLDLLQAQMQALRQIRGLLARRAAENARVEARQLALKDKERFVEALHEQRMDSIPAWSLPAAGALAAALMLGSAWSAYSDNWTVAFIAALFGVIGIVSAIWIWTVLRRNDRLRARMESAGREIEELDSETRKLERTKASIISDLRKVAADADIEQVRDFAGVEVLDAELSKQQEYAREWLAERKRISELQDKIRDAERRLMDAERAVEEKISEHTKRLHDWEKWKEQHMFSASLSVEGAIDFVDQLQAVKTAFRERKQILDLRAKIQKEIDDWSDRVRKLLKHSGEDGSSLGARDLVDAVSEINRRCTEDKNLRDKIAHVSDSRKAFDSRIEVETENLMRLREELAELLVEADAEDEEDFYRRIEVHGHRLALKQEIKRLESDLDTRLGKGDGRARIEQALVAGEVDTWSVEVEELRRTFDTLQMARDNAIRAHQSAREARSKLEESSDVPVLENELLAVDADLAAAAREWCVYTFAKKLVEETLAEFMRTRQPQVLKEASAYFEGITQSHYSRIHLTEDAQSLSVVDNQGRSTGPEILSRGTAEQLYLCLRFGLAAEYARKQVALPIVMDDVLVNFDPERASTVAKILAQVAQHHQVLLFTCHPATASLISEEAADCRLVEMPRFARAG